MANITQRNFESGEISSALYGRTDKEKYQSALRTCRNFIIQRHGSVINRSGTKYRAEVKTSANKVLLVEYSYSELETYLLEFGNGYIRFYKNGVIVAPSGVIAWVNINHTPGTLVTYGGITYYAFVETGFGAPDTKPSVWYPLPDAAILEIPSPYTTAQLPALQFAQERHIMTLTHPDVPVYELSRSGTAAWTMLAAIFGSDVPAVMTLTSPASVATTGDTTVGSYVLTNVASTVGISVGQYILVGAGMPAGPLKVMATTVNSITVDKVGTAAVVGTSIATTTGLTGPVTYWAATAVIGLNESEPLFYNSANKVPSVDSPTPIENSSPLFTESVNIYRSIDGTSYGWVGSTEGTIFSDLGNAPDFLRSFRKFPDLFDASGKYPVAVTNYQQRRLLANTAAAIETVYGSRTGDKDNFSTSFPLQDDDAVTFKMVGKKANPVRHMLDLGRLVVFTEREEKLVEGDDAGILRPSAINPRKLSAHGIGALRPVELDDSAIYVQARGTIVRDLKPVSSESYEGTDLTVFSAHLFDGYTLVDIDYQENPQSVVWVVRSDGVLLGLTYLKEFKIWGWHRHDTDGVFENVCVVPEGAEDVLYVVVKRTINGVTKRYVERFTPRFFTDVKNLVLMDCAFTYDGRNATATTMTLTGGVAWTYGELLTVTASAAFFAAGDVGNAIFFYDPATGEEIRFTLEGFTSNVIMTGHAHKTVPVGLRGVVQIVWSKAVKSLSGLSHLEGKNVAVLGDGHVVSSPNNSAYALIAVVAGAITLERPYAVVQVGLPYMSDFETLDIDTPSGPSLKEGKFLINKVRLFLEKSRGLWVGRRAPTTTPLEGLKEIKTRSTEDPSKPPDLVTDDVEVIIENNWNSNGRFFVRQVDPVPATILAAMPQGYIP